MEEIYEHILRTVLGILALVGVLWSAVRYLVKYKVVKASHEIRQYADGKMESIWARVHDVEAELYDLNIALSKIKERLRAVEKDADSQ